MPGLHHSAKFPVRGPRRPRKSGAAGSEDGYTGPARNVRRPSREASLPMTVIAIALAGNLLLAGLFSLVAVALD